MKLTWLVDSQWRNVHQQNFVKLADKVFGNNISPSCVIGYVMRPCRTRSWACSAGATCSPCLRWENGTWSNISRQSMRGGAGGGEEKSVRKAGYLLSLMGGIPGRWAGCVRKLGEDLDSLRKNTDCLASGESRQLSVLIKASQPAHRRQKTMTRSIERKRGRERERESGRLRVLWGNCK